MAGRYAADTSVSIDRSRAEIERTLARYGADRFGYGWEPGRAVITFDAHNRRVRFVLTLPDRNDRAFTHTPGRGIQRSDQQAHDAWDQACRQSWRALALVVKAKLEAVAAGITTFEAEFLAHVVLPSGETFGEWASPQLARAYQTHEMPAMLALPGGTDR